MYASVYFPLVLSAFLIPLARVSVRRFAPDVAARALTVAGLMASLCSAWGLALLVGAMAGQDGGVAHEGHWSATLVAANNPVPHWASQLAVCLLLVGAIRLGRLTFVEVRALSAGRALHPARTELVVVDDASPQAFAVPGRSARIVVTKGMLRALSPIERKVLLAHERAHLRHNHHRYQLAFALAGALNPFVAWAQRDLRYVLERWADEVAASVVGDRRATAQTLVHAARLSNPSEMATTTLAFSGLGVPDRVQALGRGAPQPRRGLATAATAAVVLPAAWAAADATLSLAHLLAASGLQL